VFFGPGPEHSIFSTGKYAKELSDADDVLST
jgi:hypothetical protein